MNTFYDDLKEMLGTVSGKIIIEVTDGVTNIKGDLNDMGLIMATYCLAKFAESRIDGDFQEVIAMLQRMDPFMSINIENHKLKKSQMSNKAE